MKLNNADFMTQITDFNHPETLEILINLPSREMIKFTANQLYIKSTNQQKFTVMRLF